MKNWFCNLKLQWKFFVILLSSLLLVFIGAMTTAHMTEQAYTDALYARTMQMLMLFGQSVQAELDDVADVSFSILADNVVQEKLSEVARDKAGYIEGKETRDEINNRLTNIFHMRNDISSLRLRAPNGIFFTQTRSGTAVPSELFDRYEQAMIDAGGRAVWAPDETAPGSLFLFRNVREIKDLTLNSIAVMGMRINMDRIVANCIQPLLQMDMPLLCAIDFQGSRVYASDERLLELAHEGDGYWLQEMNGEAFFCAQHRPLHSE